MHLAGEAWVVGALSTFQQITKFHKKKESKLWHPHTQKLMQVGFIQITINRSLKVFSFVFVFCPWFSFLSLVTESVWSAHELRSEVRKSNIPQGITILHSDNFYLFTDLSKLFFSANLVKLFLQVIWFHWRDKDKGSNFLRLSKSQQSPHWNQHQIMHYLPCP